MQFIQKLAKVVKISKAEEVFLELGDNSPLSFVMYWYLKCSFCSSNSTQRTFTGGSLNFFVAPMVAIE